MVVLVALAAGLTACGGDGDEEDAAAQGAPPAKLKVAFAANSTAAMVTYVAEAKKYFDEQGLDVEISDGNGTNTPARVLSGQTDIGMYAIGGPLLAAADGAKISFFQAQGGQGGEYLLSDPAKAKTIEELRALDSCKIASLQPGSTPYGFSRDLIFIRKFLPNCEQLLLGSNDALAATVSRGDADAVVGALASMWSLVDAGKLTILIDPSQPEAREKYFGGSYLTAAFFAPADRLEEKKDSIVNYVKAEQKAWEFIQSAEDTTIAELIRPFPPFQQRSVEDLANDVKLQRPFIFNGSTDGYITDDQWQAALKRLEVSELPGFDIADPVFSYDERVDMSHYDAANGAPGGS